ncbi:MAG: metallophosphoesterase [Armatimonadota bacterium]
MPSVTQQLWHTLRQPIPPRKLKRGLTILGLVLVAFLVYGSLIEPAWLQVSRVNLSLSRLPTEFDGVTIAQLTDLHYGVALSRGRIQAAVAATNRLHPDIVALTGDYILGHPKDIEGMVKILGGLQAPLGVYAILGNHDCNGDVIWGPLFAKNHITFLNNSAAPIKRQNARLWIAGLDDAWFGIPAPKRALRGVPPNESVVMLVHEPDYADKLTKFPVDLQLSGHSHGGQIWLPHFGAPVLPETGTKYPKGLYQVGKMQLYTNRGIGVLYFPLRLNCRPEITLVTLQAPH